VGALYRGTQRLKESADAYTEALQIYRELTKTNPQANLRYVAEVLNDAKRCSRMTGCREPRPNALSYSVA
jgi:hypothetical protein